MSFLEKEFVRAGIAQLFREDGRSLLDQRQVVLETGLVTQASGSCLLGVLEGSRLLVTCRLKVMAEPLIECFVKSSIFSKNFNVDFMCAQYSQILSRTLNSHFDLKKLVIIPHQAAWVLSIDVTVLQFSGNVLDMIFLGARACLYNTRLPKLQVEEIDGNYDFQVMEEDTVPLQGQENVPICVTVSQIDGYSLIDASLLEEECANSSISVMVDANGHVCGLQKGLKGSMNPSVLVEMVQTAKRIASENTLNLLKYLKEEEARRLNLDETTGFM